MKSPDLADLGYHKAIAKSYIVVFEIDIIANSIWTSAALTASGTQMSSASTPGVGGTFDLGNVKTGDVSYFAVVFNKTADQVGSATKYYLSADATGHSYTDLNPSEGVKAAMSIAGVTSVPITQSIPEPTSGLLLLLGVAGLALKRKHA